MNPYPVTLALIGAGNRGSGIFGRYALEMPHKAKFVAVIERDREKREAFAKLHGIQAHLCFEDVESFFAKGERYADGRAPRARQAACSLSVRNCTTDEGEKAPRNRLAGAGFKSPSAAWVKSPGREHRRKRFGKTGSDR